METLATPVGSEALAEAVASLRPLVTQTQSGDLVYDMVADDAPLIMLEISRLRELAYREIGSGSGRAIDTDLHDTGPDAYRQLFVYSPISEQIVAGMRYRRPTHADDESIASAAMFEFSRRFRDEYIADMIDMGRMFVVPQSQALSGGKRSVYALDNLFTGMGAVVQASPGIRFLFGRIVHSPLASTTMRDLVAAYLEIHNGGSSELVRPREFGQRTTPAAVLEGVLGGQDPRADMRSVQQWAKAHGESVSPLLRAYLRMCPKLVSFGTAADWDLSGIEETCLLVRIAEANVGRRARYMPETKQAVTVAVSAAVSKEANV